MIDENTNSTNNINHIINNFNVELPKFEDKILFFSSLLILSFWCIYLALYNSRILGLLLSAVLNRLLHKNGYIKIGSFSVSILSGKIMFRDFKYVTEDLSLRICYGYAIFRYWRSYKTPDNDSCIENQETRLSLYIESVEYHVYNRNQTYDKLEKLFGFKDDDPVVDHVTNELQISEHDTIRISDKDENSKWNWRDLIPIIKVRLKSSKLIFGNHLVPYSLIINVGTGHVSYSSRKLQKSEFDLRKHKIDADLENIKIMLTQSLDYSPKNVKNINFDFKDTKDEEETKPLKYDFELFNSNSINVIYIHDEPGTVPFTPEKMILINGELRTEKTYPEWLMFVTCRRDTTISYSPWADRQRETLWKLFFPLDYQPMTKTITPEINQFRKFEEFYFKLIADDELNADLLFNTDGDITKALHIKSQPDSFIEFKIPWIVEENGCTTKIRGKLKMLQATTNLDFRQLIDSEDFCFEINIDYPLEWNDHQSWRVDIDASKVNAYLLFEHKHFVSGLVNDWSSRSVPDLYNFVPYTWKFHLNIKEFCLISICNQWNWIDCTSTKSSGNCQIAFNGKTFSLGFILPFIDFLPTTVDTTIDMKGEDLNCYLYLPESHTTRYSVVALSKNLKLIDSYNREVNKPFCNKSSNESSMENQSEESNFKWIGASYSDNDWIECWKAFAANVSVIYRYHPMPILINNSYEEYNSVNFDPESLDPDIITVNIELSPSEIIAYGSLLKCFLALKDNYLGVDQKYFSFEKPIDDLPPIFKPCLSEIFDPRYYRPFSVIAKVNIERVRAHLPKNCTPSDAPCAFVIVEHIAVEVDKKFRETKIQVLTTPCALSVSDKIIRCDKAKHLSDGHLMLSSLQIRCHAMFSQSGLPLEGETIEYAWLVEATVGELSGRLTVPQLQTIVEALQTLIMLIDDSENELINPLPYLCQHLNYFKNCTEDRRTLPRCPSGEDIKYRMTRASLDCINIFIVEADTALNFLAKPIRLATCNLHSSHHSEGLTVTVDQLHLKHYLLYGPTWVESGNLELTDRLEFDAGLALPHPDLLAAQEEFLHKHDIRTKRLHFLWRDTNNPPRKCGCVGNCWFFGENRLGRKFFLNVKGSLTTPRIAEQPFFGFGQSLHTPTQFLLNLHIKQFSDNLTVGHSSVNELPDIKTISDTSSAQATNIPIADHYSDGSSRQSLLSKDTSHDISDTITPNDSVFMPQDLKGDNENYKIFDNIIDGRSYSDEANSDRFWSANEDEKSSASSFISATSSIPDFEEDGTVLHTSSCKMSSSLSTESGDEQSYEHIDKLPAPDYPYIGHLAELVCESWRSDMKITELFNSINFNESVRQNFYQIRQLQRSLLPKFIIEKNGLRPTMMLSKPEKLSSKIRRTHSSSKKSAPTRMNSLNEDDKQTSFHKVKTHVSKTSAVLKLNGSIDIFISPLLLDGIRQFVESVTPVLQQLHACGILDTMHVKSSHDVRAQNKILGLNPNFNDGVLEFSRRIQFLISLNKINLLVVQAADPKVQIDGVSLLATQVDTISAKVMFNTQTHKSDLKNNTVEQSTLKDASHKNVSNKIHDKVTDVAENILKEDQVATLSIEKIHAQVRRLKPISMKSVGDLKITCIPNHRSKACFEFQDDYANSYNMLESGIEVITLTLARRLGYTKPDDNSNTAVSDMNNPSARKVSIQIQDVLNENDGESISKIKKVIPNVEKDILRKKVTNNDESNVCKNDASTCALKVQVFWFNCAAPSGGRKMLPLPSANDWNVLSTLTPAIEAWMDSGHKLHFAVTVMVLALQNRITVVMACIMINALQDKDILKLPSNKYSKYSPVAEQLRDDPSCILVSILRKYASNESKMIIIEQGLAEKSIISQISASEVVTLQKGILAVTRQWKAQLFMNSKTEATKKCQDSYVKFDKVEFSNNERIKNDDTNQVNVNENGKLLDIFSDSIDSISSDSESIEKLSNLNIPKQLNKRSYSLPGPVISSNLNQEKLFLNDNDQHQKPSNIFQTHSNAEIISDDVSKNDMLNLVELPSIENDEADINNWIANQGESDKLKRTYSNVGHESLYAPSLYDAETISLGLSQPPSNANQLRLGDGQMLFKPLLRAIGLHLEAVKSSAMMKKFGGNCSVVAKLRTLKVHIADSESPSNTAVRVELTERPAAFISDWFSFQVDAKDTATIEKKNHDLTTISNRASIGRLQDALYNVQTVRPMTTKMYFSIGCESVEQHVNLSLLRLVHQLVTMIQRVNATQTALKMKKSHKKQDSKSSTDTNPNLDEFVTTESKGENRKSTITNQFSLKKESLPANSVNSDLNENCWKKLSFFVELYSTAPETKTVTRSKVTGNTLLTIIPEEDALHNKPNDGVDALSNNTKDKEIAKEECHIPILAFGTMRIGQIRVTASVSGLKLESRVRKVDFSLTHRINLRAKSRKRFQESSFSVTLDFIHLCLLEENVLTVINVICKKSSAFYSLSNRKRQQTKNQAASICIGLIDIEIPQHPGNLHGMVARSSKRISSTLEEFIASETAYRENSPPVDTIDYEKNEEEEDKRSLFSEKIHIRAVLEGFIIGASLLPSLKATYEIGRITGSGVTGTKARGNVQVPSHKLNFKAESDRVQSSLPEATIELPPMNVDADYEECKDKTGDEIRENSALNEGLEICTGKYVKIIASVDKFRQSLTSDLLNHLVFMQKIFRNEINDVVNKISGTEKPVALFQSRNKGIQMCFYIKLVQKGIEILATTTKPAKHALRFQTESIEIVLSNRVKKQKQSSNIPGKIYVKGQVMKLTLEIIHIVKNYVFQEAEPDYESLANFNTTISLRNALEHEMVTGPLVGDDTEAVLIQVNKPIIEIQPSAFDAAFWIWIDYRNVFEYWNEQRLALGKTATSRITPPPPITNSLDEQKPSALFLQLTVTDLCICVPLSISNKRDQTFESKNVLILTLDSTQISACSRGSLVSKGKFQNFCLRFDENDIFPDELKPHCYPVMNGMCVPNGTYEICSRTQIPGVFPQRRNAKWVLNVTWKMKGLDINFNTKIGEKLAALGKTLTSFADNGSGHIYTEVNEALLEKLERKKKEKEILVDDLKACNYSPDIIAKEERKLERIKEILRHLFVKSRFSKFENETKRAFKKQLGISNKHKRTKSLAGPEFRREVTTNNIPSDPSSGSPSSIDSCIRIPPARSGHSRGHSLDVGELYINEFKDYNHSKLEPTKLLIDSSSDESEDSISLSSQDSTPGIDIYDESQNTLGKPNRASRSQVIQQVQVETSVDFEMDVKVKVESGQCVLHPKELETRNPETDDMSKITSRPRALTRASTSRLKFSSEMDNRTVFFLPGVDIKLQYNSKTDSKNRQNMPFKKAGSLYCWLTLNRLSEEMLIKTFLLDFLDQVLENVPQFEDGTLSATPSTNESDGNDVVEFGETTLNAAESFPVDVIVYIRVHPSTIRFSCLPAERIECKLGMPSLDIVFSTKKADESEESGEKKSGGLCITARLADFSFKIYHLFNIHKNVDSMSSIPRPKGSGDTTYSLIVNLKYVNLSISRTRRIHDNLNIANIIRFSSVCDIGDATFEFDMKRLQDILNFPKHWYRSSLARRLFFGDEKKIDVAQDFESVPLDNEQIFTTSTPLTKTATYRRSSKSLPVQPTDLNKTMSKKWETRVLFTGRFSKLDVQVKIMLGTLNWNTVGLICQSSWNIDSTGFKDMQIKSGFNSSKIICNTVVVSGLLDLRNVTGDVRVIEAGRDSKKTPMHSADFNLGLLQTRFEYMSNNILIGRLNNFCVLIKDIWVLTKNEDTSPTMPGLERKTLVSVEIIGKLLWDKLHLMITKRTTPDLITAINQISQRITTEYVNSMKIFGIKERPKSMDDSYDCDTDSLTKEMRFHRHWQTVLERIRSQRYYLNGNLTLQGNNLTLACFDGNSFQAKDWVIFMLDEPTIIYDTNPRDNYNSLDEQQNPNAIIYQTLNFQLGHNIIEKKDKVSQIMATICRVIRNGEGIKNLASSVTSWFNYAFGCKDMPGLTAFPLLDDKSNDSSLEKHRKPSQHDTEIIFLLPALTMRLLTEHHQENKQPTIEDPKAFVDCKFVTDFYDDISVTVNIEAMVFLGTLIFNYIDTVENSDGLQDKFGKKVRSDIKNPTVALKEDHREFKCINWRLEPTIKMLLAGKSCEPFGIDKILKYLGVKHASKTIPTWLQRGVLDLLDKFVSILMLKILNSQKLTDK